MEQPGERSKPPKDDFPGHLKDLGFSNPNEIFPVEITEADRRLIVEALYLYYRTDADHGGCYRQDRDHIRKLSRKLEGLSL